MGKQSSTVPRLPCGTKQGLAWSVPHDLILIRCKAISRRTWQVQYGDIAVFDASRALVVKSIWGRLLLRLRNAGGFKRVFRHFNYTDSRKIEGWGFWRVNSYILIKLQYSELWKQTPIRSSGLKCRNSRANSSEPRSIGKGLVRLWGLCFGVSCPMYATEARGDSLSVCYSDKSIRLNCPQEGPTNLIRGRHMLYKVENL
jgi:hypothetical protein